MFLSILMAAAQPAGAPANLLVELVAGEGERRCLPDNSLCLNMPAAEEGGDAGKLIVTFPASGRSDGVSLPLEPGEGAKLWSRVITVPVPEDQDRKDYLVGILTEERAMYSGGGGSGGRLHLMRLNRTGDRVTSGAEVLDVVWDSSLLIRACFSGRDMEDRLGACHDEYNFTGTLAAAEPDGGILPSLVYRTVATAYPQTSRRSEDNSNGVKLKKSDLSPWRDPECSYTRVLHFNPATGRYEMDRPAPDCSSYTTP